MAASRAEEPRGRLPEPWRRANEPGAAAPQFKQFVAPRALTRLGGKRNVAVKNARLVSRTHTCPTGLILAADSCRCKPRQLHSTLPNAGTGVAEKVATMACSPLALTTIRCGGGVVRPAKPSLARHGRGLATFRGMRTSSAPGGQRQRVVAVAADAAAGGEVFELIIGGAVLIAMGQAGASYVGRDHRRSILPRAAVLFS